MLQAGVDFPEAIRGILAARALMDTARRERIVGTKVIVSDENLLDYLKTRLCRNAGERLLIIFCDQARQYIIDEEMGLGSANTVRLDSADLIRRALTLGASAILLAHNHPSGRCEPSEQDIAATGYLERVAHAYGIDIIDHLVVTSDAVFSMRIAGLLRS